MALQLIFSEQTNKIKNCKIITYAGNISNKISKIISLATNTTISFKTERDVSTTLLNVKTKISPLNKSGIYKFNCSESNAVYLGQTFRNFEIRCSEQLRANIFYYNQINPTTQNIYLTPNIHSLERIIHSRSISRNLKIGIYKTIIRPIILLYITYNK